MIISEEDFVLTPVSDDSDLYDLDLLYIVNKGKSNERKEFKNAGYGLPLNRAIRKIIHYRTQIKLDTVDIKTALKEYLKNQETIKNLLHEVLG